MESSGKILNLFLIEDNEGDIKLIEQFCALAGGFCITHIAKDGEEAMNKLKSFKTHAETLPDIIILDLNLPKISGLELLKELQNDHRLNLIPVIVFSSSLKIEDIDSAYDLGANVYMEKPFDAKTYEEVMQRMWKFWSECVIKVNWNFVKKEIK
jgi:CheY-like chemotaxis protein